MVRPQAELRSLQLAFFGRVTASLSHEINNVLSTINELSGLMGDLLAGAARGRQLDAAKLNKISERIAAQIQRGETLIKRLNRFSHSADEARKTFDLQTLVEEVLALAARPASRQGFELFGSYPGDSINIHGDPFAFQHLIFAALELLWTNPTAGKKIEIALRRCAGGGELSFTTGGGVNVAAGAERTVEMLALARQLGVGVALPEAATGQLILTIPAEQGT